MHSLLVTLGGVAVAWLLRALGATWRIRGEPERALSSPFVGALWHHGLFVAAYTFRDRGAVVPVSLSRDGDRVAEVLRRLGFGPSPRGSSSRGAIGVLATLIRRAREGRTIGILADGPRGPARRLKPGALAVARASGLPVRPVGIAASPCIRFGSWDRVLLPLPFARVACVFGPGIPIPAECDRDELERRRVQLEQEVDRQDQQAAALLLRATPETSGDPAAGSRGGSA